MFSGIIALLTALGSIATAAGVFFAWQQLRHTRRQSQTAFEDGLNREYRDIALCLPLRALLWEELDAKEHAKALEHFYHYFDRNRSPLYVVGSNDGTGAPRR